MLKGTRFKDVYIVDRSFKPAQAHLCFMSLVDKTQHANLQLVHKLHNQDKVRGLPKVRPSADTVCDACARGKQTRTSFKRKSTVSSSRPLEQIHMDLCGPMRTGSVSGKRYVFVIVDDFSIFT